MGKSKKSFYTLLPAAILFVSIWYAFVHSNITGMIYADIYADDVTSEVDVGNTAPSFTVDPHEDPASSGTAPTNVGSAVTFKATATDPNGSQYFLAICKGTGITPGAGGPPTCTAGDWEISVATNSGSEATAAYTALAGDAESNAWYAYVCDYMPAGASCSAYSQGTGDSGSPFKVNHVPVFSDAQTDAANYNPGSTVNWTTTASDSDTDTASDTVKLVVCKTQGVTGDECDGGAADTWCTSSLSASNPTCGYEIPTPTHDDIYYAYTYVFDSHDFPASGGYQNAPVNYTVNNIAPVVTDVTINAGSDLTLTESTTTAFTLTATVTDNNACNDLSAVTGYVYRSGIAYTGCDTVGEAEDNYCYPEVSCSVGGVNTCDGSADSSAGYTCTVNIQFHADPTDANTQYPTEGWQDTLKAVDDNSTSDTTEVAAAVEMNSLVAYDVTTSIDYGSLAVGEKNDPLDKITTITATGNVGLDEELSGVAMTDGGTGSIAASYQHYALAGSTAYASGTALSGTPTEAELNCQKTTGTPATKNSWWGLLIPTGTLPGTYTGTDTIVAIKGEIVNW